MVFLTLICPGCQKSTIIDDEDETSYCMHCGTAFDPAAVAEADPLDPVVSAALQMSGALGEEYEPEDYSGEEWYDDVRDVMDSILSGDDATDRLVEVLDAHPDQSEDMEACIRDMMVTGIIDALVDGEPYVGGFADVARIVEEYTDDNGPNILLASMFYALVQTPEIMRCDEDAGIIAETLFNLLVEYPQVETDIRMQLEMCTDFMHVTGLLIDAADAMSDDEDVMAEVRQWIYTLQDFVRILGDAIYDATDSAGEDRLDQLTQAWVDADISTIGCNVEDIADRYLDGAIDGDGVRKEVDAYLADYLGL